MSPKNNVVKNSVMLYGMSIAKLVFPLITLGYLMHTLSKECYGVVGYVKAAMSYMQLLVDFGFMLSGTKSIVEARDDKKRLGEVAGNIFLSRIILSGIAALILIVLTIAIPILRANALFTFLSFLPVVLTIFLFDYLFRGIEKMEVIAGRFIVMRAIAVALTFVFVREDTDIMWIPILDTLGTVVAIVMVLFSLKKLDLKMPLGSVKEAWGRIYESFVYFISSMASSAFGALNTLIIGIFMLPEDIAYWSICLQFVNAIQALYTPISDGVYPEMVKSKDLKLIRKILIIFMPIVLIGSAFSYAIIPWVFSIVGGGTKYVGAVPVFRALIPVLIFSFPAIIIGWPTLGAFGKQNQVTLSTILTAIFQVGGILVLIAAGKFTLINLCIVRCLTELVLLLVRGVFLYKILGKKTVE